MTRDPPGLTKCQEERARLTSHWREIHGQKDKGPIWTKEKDVCTSIINDETFLVYLTLHSMLSLCAVIINKNIYIRLKPLCRHNLFCTWHPLLSVLIRSGVLLLLPPPPLLYYKSLKQQPRCQQFLNVYDRCEDFITRVIQKVLSRPGKRVDGNSFQWDSTL